MLKKITVKVQTESPHNGDISNYTYFVAGTFNGTRYFGFLPSTYSPNKIGASLLDVETYFSDAFSEITNIKIEDDSYFVGKVVAQIEKAFEDEINIIKRRQKDLLKIIYSEAWSDGDKNME